MEKNKIYLIVLLAIVCLVSAIAVNKKLSESRDMKKYKQAITFYQTEDYQNAYYNFSAVSEFSILKQAALFRQARCATILGDFRSAVRNYNIFLKRFPNSPLYAVSEYNLAVLLYEEHEYSSAKRHFTHIYKHFKDKEVSIASGYYLGLLENKPELLLEYIKASPSGRFALSAIDALIKNNVNLSNADNLLIANSYLANEKHKEALECYQKTSLCYSWCGYAKTLYKLGKYDEAKKITVKGLSNYSSFVDEAEIYGIIDCFVSLSSSKLNTIKYLLSLNPKAKGADYLMFLMAKNSPSVQTPQIYEQLYAKFPNGQFSGEALYKTFYSKVAQRKYKEAIKLGKLHLSKFGDTNSAPAVMYWLAKVYEKQHVNDLANSYYKGVVSRYPDSYYAMRANAKLKDNSLMFEKDTITYKSPVFPISNKTSADLAIKLANLGDYDFIQELYKNDDFVQSWIEYKKGNYTNSVIIARDAMNKLSVKPNFKDVRWRLVYPVHYYEYVKKYSNEENSIILLSILKEESHFNPKITSPVGAGGLMQLMPATANEIAKQYGISNNLYIPESNIRLGCLYYAKIKRTLNNKDMSAIMAYNGGWASVMNWKKQLDYTDMDDFIEKIPYPETQDYIKKVLKSYWNYSNIY